MAQVVGQATQLTPPNRKVPYWQLKQVSALVVTPVTLSVVLTTVQDKQLGSIPEKEAQVSRKAQTVPVRLKPETQSKQPVLSQESQLAGQAMQERLPAAM